MRLKTEHKSCVGKIRAVRAGYYIIDTNHPAKHLRVMYLRPQDLGLTMHVGEYVELRYSRTPSSGMWVAVGPGHAF